ncbi:uncharacterized protein SAPINGB_P005123 [Magnusiomyces paraingens]|uniref:DUF202 domain-containing protein n=1 Tax=Magnusiomyces paraingens TaxID=2606893 RepID=A0A5E8C0V7_9ASCO|nr:uncharacterized protein SAPINGB_P005123 [Saprochaete ingens]VVT56515.1 unnamed protein product [Saprochaete ingens]
MPSSNALKPALASALGHSRSPSTSSITSVASDAVLIPTPQPAQTTSPLGPSVNQVDIYSGLPPLLVPKPQQETVQQREHVNGESDDDAGANQRTFEGAYVRTALGQLSFALVILKIFSREFLPIGTVFTVQGILILVIAFYRRHKTIKDIFTVAGGYRAVSQDHNIVFQTSGPTVLLLSSISILTYIALFILIQKLSPNYGDS